ncbi:hypothetical protein ACIO6U_03680 [Streptomyces sp. NPDC087422]|uniref:hypothetical protein n=1 Tax=Streptomyces sp. NPDC087422 TaxID=3365786 RepID=UPI003814595D
MPTPADQLPPDLTTLARQVADLRRELSELRAGRRLESAAIGAGGLKITKGGRLATETPGGQRVLDSGAISSAAYAHPDGSPQQAFFIRREDGTLALSLYANPSGSGFAQFVALWDRAGNIVVSDDAASGVGVARPYIPFTLAPALGTGWDYWPRTTSATMADLLVGQIYKQQPKAAVVVVAATDTAGTTGQLQLTISGTAVGAAQAVTTSGNFFTFTADLTAYDHMQQIAVSVAGRRTAGTGALRANFYTASTIQS